MRARAQGRAPFRVAQELTRVPVALTQRMCDNVHKTRRMRRPRLRSDGESIVRSKKWVPRAAFWRLGDVHPEEKVIAMDTTLEPTMMTTDEVLERLAERGIRTSEFADAAGIDRAAMSAILHGRQYCGPARKARIERAIVALGLDRDAPDHAGELVFAVTRAG